MIIIIYYIFYIVGFKFEISHDCPISGAEVWIDGDAMVLDHGRALKDFVAGRFSRSGGKNHGGWERKTVT
jgi:hypothetical protein